MALGPNRSPNQIFGLSLIKIPKSGDAEILPKGRVVRPSRERMPFDSGGRLKPEGPGPYPEDFLHAADLEDLPWTRDRGQAWTSPEFRTVVMRWLKDFMRSRPSLIRWDITERSAGFKTATRLPDDQFYLRIGVTERIARGRSVRVETAIAFPVRSRSDAAQVRTLLDLVSGTLDTLLG